MDLMQIRGFHDIEGESRMPNITEHHKHIRWNDSLKVFEYITVSDLHVDNVTQANSTITIHRNDGTAWDINIPNVDNLDLPGDTMILFDEDDTIGGRNNLTYDYVNNRIILTDSGGIFGKNTAFDTTIQSIVQYLGNGNLFINFGDTKTPSSIMEFNNAMGQLALSTIQEGKYNIAVGYKAGGSVERTTNSSVYIGSYAGRLNTEDNKLFIHNTDFNTLAEFQEQSLFYGEFDTGLLHINNRLDVSQEVQIGEFNVANSPAGGMVQFVDAADPTYVKPQYYDNTQWVDFANGTNNYLTSITNVGENWSFHINGLSDIDVIIPDVSYPSSGNKYRLQLSNGDSTFTHDDNLNWTINDVLEVDGAINIAPRSLSDFSDSEGLLINTGQHVYMYIDGTYKQLDNEPTAGQTNEGESIGTTVEVYAGMNSTNHKLQFYDLEGGTKLNIFGGNIDGNILLNVDYTVYGSNSGAIGHPLYIDNDDTSNESILNFRKLYSSDGSVVITENSTYLDLTVTGGVAAGESNTGENVGAGEGRIWDEVNKKNGLNILFRTLKSGTNVNISTDTADQIIDVSVDPFVNEASNISGGIGVFKDYSETSGKRVLNMRPLLGINDIDIALNNDVIEVGLDTSISIPSITGIPIPVSTNSDKTLTWNVTLDSDIRNSNPVLEAITQLNLGSNLIYNASTNMLDAIGGSGDPLSSIGNVNIVRNVDGSVDRSTSTRNIRFTKTSGVYVDWDGSSDAVTGLGWLAFENDYPVASDTQKGILQVNITNGLTITNGVLDITLPEIPVKKDAVLYYPDGYDLHDYDAGSQGSDDGDGISPSELITVRRNRVRASIGAPYVNGSNSEPFIASELIIGTTGNWNDDNNWGGETRNTYIHDNKISSDLGNIQLVKPRPATPTNYDVANKVSVGNGVMDLTIDPRDLTGGIGVFNFYMYNTSGTKVKVASIKGRYESGELVADLRVKGDIKFHCTDAEMT